MNEPLGLHKFTLQKILTEALFLLVPAANMLGTSQFPNVGMKWQLVVILESICEIESTINFIPAQGTGLRTHFLTCFPIFFFSLLSGQFNISPTSLPSALRTNLF